MARRWLILVMAIGLFAKLASPTLALRLRAVQPNPVGSDEGEWILLENELAASASGMLVLQDGYGGVKKFQQALTFSPNELKMFPKSLTGIALNNDLDQVILTWSSSSITATESSALLSNSEESLVWWQDCQGEWQKTAETEFSERISQRSWCVVTPSPSLTPVVNASPTPTVKPSVSPILTTTGVAKDQGQPSTAPTPKGLIARQWPQLHSSASASEAASLRTDMPLPLPLDPPVSLTPEQAHAEVDVFRRWKEEAILGALLIIFGGGCWVSLAVIWLWQLLYSNSSWHAGGITSLRWDPP